MSDISIRIPTPLRGLTGGASDVSIEAATVGEALKFLEEKHPGLAGRLLTEEGTLRGFVNVFVGDTDIRNLQGLETPLQDGASLAVLPAVAGGQG